MSQTVDATFFAQIQPEWSQYERDKVTGAKVLRLTQHKPDHPIGGTVTVKLTVRLPVAAFLPLTPEAVIVVPETMTEAHPIEVIASSARDGEQ